MHRSTGEQDARDWEHTTSEGEQQMTPPGPRVHFQHGSASEMQRDAPRLFVELNRQYGETIKITTTKISFSTICSARFGVRS
jgi:hypothetical protein